jgi:hypothetical protein
MRAPRELQNIEQGILNSEVIPSAESGRYKLRLTGTVRPTFQYKIIW